MYYILYQITNKLNSKIYVGVHKTKDLEDGYMGSGKVIKAAIAKHGIENFEKKILKTFNNADDMFAAEAALVTEEFLAREDVYNLRRGELVVLIISIPTERTYMVKTVIKGLVDRIYHLVGSDRLL